MPEDAEHGIFNLLDEIENMVEQARPVPMTGRVMINRDELLALVGELRHALPRELGEARWLLQDRERVLAEARAQADELLAKARETLEVAARDHEIYRRAEELAESLIGKAKLAADEIRTGADAYADDVLAQLETILQKSIDQVAAGRRELQERRAARPPVQGGQS